MSENDEVVRPPHAPRMREHVGMIRWERDHEGGWRPVTITGQFAGSNGQVWLIRLYDGIEIEYDLASWAPFRPTIHR